MTKETDNWETPKWLMNTFERMYEGVQDACPIDSKESGFNCLKIDKWDYQGVIYLNPPYSDPLPFVLKGIEEHKKSKALIVFLLKVDTTTKWYKALVEANAHFLYFAERLHYSESKESPPFSSMLAILSD